MNRWSPVSRMLLGSLLLLLAACGGGGPSSITVSGRVIDLFGRGVGGLKVKIGSTTVTTAASGSFSISGVTTPYDAVVYIDSSTAKVAHYYKGLTRPDPTLTVFPPIVSSTSSHFANLSGTLSNLTGTNTNPILVFFDSSEPETLGGSTTLFSNANSALYGVFTTWLSSTFSTTGKVYALEWEPDSTNPNLPGSYKGFGSTNTLSLTHTGFLSPVDVALNPVSTNTLSANVTLSGGTYTLNQLRVKLRVPSGLGTELFTDTSGTTGSISYKLPAISGATVSLAAGAADANDNQSYAWKAGLATNANNVSLTLPAAPSLSQDPVGNVTTTTTFKADFTATGFSGGVNVFHFYDTFNSPNDPDFYVITTANTTTIPDLSGIGLGLPSGINYSWRVLGVAPFTTTDAAAGPGGFLRDFVKATQPFINAAPGADGSAVGSAPSTFTTQ